MRGYMRGKAEVKEFVVGPVMASFAGFVSREFRLSLPRLKVSRPSVVI